MLWGRTKQPKGPKAQEAYGPTTVCTQTLIMLSCELNELGAALMWLQYIEGFNTLTKAATPITALLTLPSAQKSELAPSPPEMATLGSIEHPDNCRPCSFFHKQGCDKDDQCMFCHFCQPDEKRRRQKEKRVQLKQKRLEHLENQQKCYEINNGDSSVLSG